MSMRLSTQNRTTVLKGVILTASYMPLPCKAQLSLAPLAASSARFCISCHTFQSAHCCRFAVYVAVLLS